MKYFLILLFFAVTYNVNSQVNQQWAARYNGLSSTTDKANAIAVDAAGNVYVTGESEVGTITRDYVTIKYNPSGVQQWAARYNGPGNYIDQAYSVAVDKVGNVYVTGGSRGVGTERDFCTIKYNSNGDSLWVKRYNGPGNDIDEAIKVVVDDTGNVYVTGYSDGGVNLDYCTIKYNSSGDEQWTARYDGPATGTGSEDRPHSMAVDIRGNIYVTGESSTGVGFIDMYATIKYNTLGDSLWVARYFGSGHEGLSQAYAVAFDLNGNVYVTGRSDDSSGFGFNFDILTIKYNSSGDSQWVARFNGSGNSSDVANAIVIDGKGNVIVTGLTVGTTADYCTIKYSTLGELLWVAMYNGPSNGIDVASSMGVDVLNNVYVTGYSSGMGSGNDYTTVKYNSKGIQQWVQRYNGPGNSADQSAAIAIDASANVIVTGESNGSGTGSDYSTIKYSQLVKIPFSYERAGENKLSENFPNPFNPVTKISYQLAVNSRVSLMVYDILGNEIATLVNENQNAGSYSVEWNAGDFASGVYFYRLVADGFSETRKMNFIK